VTYSCNCRGAVYIQRNRHRRGCDTGSDKGVGKSMSFKTIRTGSKHDFNGRCLGMLAYCLHMAWRWLTWYTKLRNRALLCTRKVRYAQR